MKNSDLVKILRDIGFLTEMEDEANSTFKARAYYRAAETIEHFPVNVKDLFSEKGLSGLLEIPSVGNAIAQKIGEYIKTGKVKHLEELKKKIPIEIDELSGIEGIGPKT